MKKLRSINTKFWDDTWVVDLNPNEKLIWLYLLTNPLTNLIGVYEISLKKIQFDTGLESFESVSKAFERFERDKKAYYFQNFVILVNFYSNQSFNSNMLVGAKKEFDLLPNSIKNMILGKDLKGFQRLSKGLQILRKVEVEVEVEYEDEYEKTTTTTRDENFEKFESEVQLYFKKNVPAGFDYMNESKRFIQINELKNWKGAGGRENWKIVADLFIQQIEKFNNNGKGKSGNSRVRDFEGEYQRSIANADRIIDQLTINR